MGTIERSPGLPAGFGFVCGGGYSGATEDLDQAVVDAAERLAAVYRMPVTIRFNSDRRSGGAWLKTDEPDGMWLNAEVGVCFSLHDSEISVCAHVGRRVGEHAHERVKTVDEAFRYLQENADVSKL